MANELYLSTKFIVDAFTDNKLINTITYEKTNDIDLNKSNIFPLINIDIIESSMVEEMIYFNYLITIVSDRNVENTLNNDKIFNSNMVDNLNECHSIAVKFVNNVKSQYNNASDIEISQVSTIRMLKFNNTNILDGVQFNLQLEIPNTTEC